MLFNKRKKLNIFILLVAAAAVLSLPVAATATKYIPSDPCIGTWDAVNRTYTLNTDVSETIRIDEDDLTLDGDGHTVTGPGSGSGVYLYQRSNVTITNLTVEGFDIGIYLDYICQNNTLTGNTVSNNSSGIYLVTSSGNTLTGNSVSNNISGIYLHNSSTNLIYNNNFIDNNTQAWVLGTSIDNVFNQPPPTGGNYWSDWTVPDADCDGFVDEPYTFFYGVDNLPWTEMNGWKMPSEMMLDLADYVIELNLQQGISNSLDAKLDAALGALDDINANNDVAAINTLQAFINAVEAQRGNKITEADADDLIDTANNIIVALQNGCY
jgi:parallel beta-helix repeat protein